MTASIRLLRRSTQSKDAESEKMSRHPMKSRTAPSTFVALLALLSFAGCSKPATEPQQESRPHAPLPPGAEAMSLFGQPLGAPPLAADKRAEREKQLDEARAMPANHPDRDVWIGRRLAYLGRFQESIAAFTDGIARRPDDARLYRHRGHRYISTRRFDEAARDLEKAAKLIEGKADEIEPDMTPSAKGPVNSLRSSVWYHLALAHYLRRDDEKALRACEEGLKVADNPDRLCSTSYWTYLTLRRLGRHDDAKKLLVPIKVEWDLVESGSYHKLLLVYRGDRKPDDVAAAARTDQDGIQFPTVGYGLATWHRLEGRKAEADALRAEVLTSPNWHAFGFIASESEAAKKVD
jgi:tetratricopeptide (TPR) repeat protein